MIRSLVATLGFTATLFAAVFFLEQAHSEASAEVDRSVLSTRTPVVESADASRVFILLLDGWRSESAQSGALMPHLTRLRELGVSAELKTVYEGFTGPAVQAAFTGRSRTQVFSVLYNFAHKDFRVESLFSDLDRSGGSAIAYGEGHFMQFGDVIEERIAKIPDVGDMYEYTHALPDLALDAFEQENPELMIAHIHGIDWTAHEVGIYGERYAEEHAWTDELILRLHERLGDNVTLIVMGDHGHNKKGEHKAGLDIPTFFFGRGPSFGEGIDLGTLAMIEVRNLVALPLGLPLVGDDAVATRAAAATESPPRERLVETSTLPTPSLGWIALSLVAIAFACGVVLRFAGGSWNTVLGGAGVLVLFAGLGIFMAPGSRIPGAAWLTVGVAVMLGTLVRATRDRPTWLVWGGLVFAVMLPSTLMVASGWSHYLWTGLYLVTLQWMVRRDAPDVSKRQMSILVLATTLVTLPLVSLPIGPNSWLDFSPTGLGLGALLVFNLGGKLAVLLCAPGSSTRRKLPWAVVTMTVLAGMQWWVLPQDRFVDLGIVIGFLAASFVPGSASRQRIFLLGALYALAYHMIDLPPQIWAWTDGVLGVLVVTSVWASRQAPSDVGPHIRAALLAAAAFVGYDVVVGWRIGGLEWQVLYEWFDHVAIELNVAPYVPLIALKTVLVFAVARVAMGRLSLTERSWAWGAIALKIAAVVAFSAGLSTVRFETEIVMPHFEEAGIMLIFLWVATPLRRRISPCRP
jgi:Type I phosphodiesterase / nucleotide pyrophosphatase